MSLLDWSALSAASFFAFFFFALVVVSVVAAWSALPAVVVAGVVCAEVSAAAASASFLALCFFDFVVVVVVVVSVVPVWAGVVVCANAKVPPISNAQSAVSDLFIFFSLLCSPDFRRYVEASAALGSSISVLLFLLWLPTMHRKVGSVCSSAVRLHTIRVHPVQQQSRSHTNKSPKRKER